MKIENLPGYRIAFIRRIGPYGTNNVQTMSKLKEWAKENDLLNNGSIILGIALDNPETTNPENCRYDTCIVISHDYSITESYVNEGNINGGKYAVFIIEHTADAVQKAWGEIFPGLARQRYVFDEARPIIERYIVEMVNNHLCEICVPIR